MIDQHADGDSARAYYHVLEADESGRPPDDPLFKRKDWSAFQVIAKRGDKVLQLNSYGASLMMPNGSFWFGFCLLQLLIFAYFLLLWKTETHIIKY